MIKISFVLPCYNVERYIADCLNSIYGQDMPEDEFEVVCVNDCSTDGTRNVIVGFAKIHPNLTLIDHERNMTVGGARNTGMKAARGEYIWFVDPDDAIKSEKVSGLYEKAHEDQLDILMFNFDFVDENLKFIQSEKRFADSEVMTGQDYVLAFFLGDFSKLCIIWRCLFRTSFLKENNMSFPQMKQAEDVVFLWKATLMALRMQSIDELAYVYRVNPYSVGAKGLNANVMFSDRILRAFEIHKMLEDKNIVIKEPLAQDMKTALTWCANSNLILLRKMQIDERKRYYDEIVDHKEAVDCVKTYLNRKQKRVFEIRGGKRLWLFKIKCMCWLENARGK